MAAHGRPTTEEFIKEQISEHDIVFINQGLHYDRTTLLIEGAIQFHKIGQMIYGEHCLCCSFLGGGGLHSFRPTSIYK